MITFLATLWSIYFLLPNVLCSQSLLEMGTKDLTFVQLNQLIGRKTGGISVYPFTSSIRGNDKACTHIIVRGKAMSGCAEDLFNLVYNFQRFILYIYMHCLYSWVHSCVEFHLQTSFSFYIHISTSFFS